MASLSEIVSASINLGDGTFNITGNGVDGEGTYAIANGTAEIGLHVVIGQMAQKQQVIIAGDKAAVNSLKTTQSDHTETELTFTKEGKICQKIRILSYSGISISQISIMHHPLRCNHACFHQQHTAHSSS